MKVLDKERNLVPVEEGGEDEDDGREGEPRGLTNVTPAQGRLQLQLNLTQILS